MTIIIIVIVAYLFYKYPRTMFTILGILLVSGGNTNTRQQSNEYIVPHKTLPRQQATNYEWWKDDD